MNDPRDIRNVPQLTIINVGAPDATRRLILHPMNIHSKLEGCGFRLQVEGPKSRRPMSYVYQVPPRHTNTCMSHPPPSGFVSLHPVLRQLWIRIPVRPFDSMGSFGCTVGFPATQYFDIHVGTDHRCISQPSPLDLVSIYMEYSTPSPSQLMWSLVRPPPSVNGISSDLIVQLISSSSFCSPVNSIFRRSTSVIEIPWAIDEAF